MTYKTKLARDTALAHIETAQTNLYAAARNTSDLQGWADEWRAIGDAADAVKRLWHRVNEAPLPTGHDHDDDEPAPDAP